MLAGNSRGGSTWSRLPETGREIDAIVELYQTVGDAGESGAGNLVLLRDGEATESAFRSAASDAQWLHLATHGYFAPPEMKSAMSPEVVAESQSMLERSGPSGEGPAGRGPAPFRGFSPGQLSGLVFAGANCQGDTIGPLRSEESVDDGIMTADEIAYLELESVDLAVLSACETGLGATAGGEGILGLQRAFQVAGARTTVTSLWQVDGAATRALMVDFYRNLLDRKLGRLEALREAQLWLLNNPSAIEGRDLTTRGQVRETKPAADDAQRDESAPRSLPAFWGAFQLSGDPR